ncbi:MAG TPA: hypothetical protein VG245_11675 [Candidatus Dormibacteraeota bacterium]|nr:hypothetical protein [Candidatus Dormibacteraeota bacterium]
MKKLVLAPLTALTLLAGGATATAAATVYTWRYTPAGAISAPGGNPPDGCSSYLGDGVIGGAHLCLDGAPHQMTASVADAAGRPAIGMWSISRGGGGNSPGGVVCGQASFGVPAGYTDVFLEVGGDPRWCGPAPAVFVDVPLQAQATGGVLTLSIDR